MKPISPTTHSMSATSATISSSMVGRPFSPLGSVAGGGAADFPAGTGRDPFAAYVWTEENLVSSYGKARIVSLSGLPHGARELCGEWAHITGNTNLEGNFLRPPFAGGDGASLVTDDGFDQVQCYHAITSLMHYLSGLGFDMTNILGSLKPVRAMVNAVDDLNAWFSPATGELTFGTARESRFGEWHLASDHDIVRHETGHLILHRLNEGLTSWFARDGGAIHEGFGDGMAALHHNDSQIGEDFLPNIGREYGTERGLRDVNNALVYDKVDRGVHSLGRVYGGFWWGLRTALEPMLEDGRKAADLTAAFMVNHASHYATNKPGPVDFMDAAIAGARAYLANERGKGYGVDMATVEAAMRSEAVRRNMLKSENAKIAAGRKRLTVDLLRRLMSSGDTHAFAYRSSSVAAGTFGGRIFHQQYFVAEDRHFVKMLGSGLIVFTDLEGKPWGYSDRDVRWNVKAAPVINVSRAQALKSIQREAARQLEMSTRTLDGLDRKGMVVGEEDGELNRELYRMEIERRRDEVAHRMAQDLDHHLAEPVLMPEGYHGGSTRTEDMYWMLPIHFSEFFVNTRTGSVAVKKMPMW